MIIVVNIVFKFCKYSLYNIPKSLYLNQSNNKKRMSLLNREDMLPKVFCAYSVTTQRITFQLNELVQLIKLQPQPSKAIIKQWDSLSTPRAIVQFKWLILVNKLIMEFSIQPSQIMEVLQNFKEPQISNEFDLMLNKKLIIPYKLYLMKRCQFLPKKSSQIDRMYQLLNLLHTAASFSDIIYTLGRYYGEMYSFTVDFNIVLVLGGDLGTVYRQMIKYTPKPTPQDILDEFEKLHEKLYVVYYNCYFYKSLKPFVPQWIVTDETQTQIKTIGSKGSFMSNKSMVDTACSSKTSSLKSKNKLTNNDTSLEDLSKSSVFSSTDCKSNKMQESMMLLKSMQRVFEEIQDF